MGTIEKRKSPRIIVDFVSVEVYVNKSATERESEIREICSIRNISETGMMFEIDKPFDPGTILRLTFALPDSPIVIRTDAIIIHTTKKKTYELGVQFKNLALAEQNLLRHFLNRAIARNQP
jgi:hypothetical protein